jgi:hypothetical protein
MMWQTYSQTVQLLCDIEFWVKCESRIIFTSLILSFNWVHSFIHSFIHSSIHSLHGFCSCNHSIMSLSPLRESDNNWNSLWMKSIYLWYVKKSWHISQLWMTMQEKRRRNAHQNLLPVQQCSFTQRFDCQVQIW